MNVCMCTKTIFMSHCETGNIWTHLLPALYFLYHLLLLNGYCIINDNDYDDDNNIDDDIIQIRTLYYNNDYYSNMKNTTSKRIQMMACLAILFTMTSSTNYHVYSAISTI